MELNIKSFILMAVTLVIGVLLIAGVVTPVIADVSSNGDGEGSGETYTNEGHGFLSATDQSTSVTYYPVSNMKYSTQPDSVADRPVYDAPIYFLANNEAFIVSVLKEMGGPSYFQVHSVDNSEDGVMADTLTLSGTTLTFTPRNGGTAVTISNIIYYSAETGDFTFVIASGDSGLEYGTYYAFNNTPVYCFGEYYSDTFTAGAAEFVISGNVGSNTLSVFEAETGSNSAVFTITDNQISDISFSIESVDVSISIASLDSNEDVSMVMVLPVEVGGSGGSGISPTLTTILSVIPLILTVGLVIGAIGFLRMKN